jgi:ketosteroid isomerase-like protein
MPAHTSDQKATPDLVALLRESMEATNRGEFAAAIAVFAPDVVFDMSAAGLGEFDGVAAVRAYLEDWIGAYDEQQFGEWDGHDLGGGVVLAVVRLDARPAGSDARVQETWAFTVVWDAGMITRVIADRDLERARALARRLAEPGARAAEPGA